VDVDKGFRVTSFIEKPENPPSNLINMGVYLFNTDLLDRVLWEDHHRKESSHDFGKDILPRLVAQEARVFAYPYTGYWGDVGTIESYWYAHVDLLVDPPSLDLNDRSWIVHTRTEERPPARIAKGAEIMDSMITDGCIIESEARIERSVLAPGVRVMPGALVRESVILTDALIESGAVIERAIIDKHVRIGKNSRVGSIDPDGKLQITMIGKNSQLASELTVQAGAVIATDVIPSDIISKIIPGDAFIQTRRKPHEV
jgi:glucose-1-phosphate adenylyltransferase